MCQKLSTEHEYLYLKRGFFSWNHYSKRFQVSRDCQHIWSSFLDNRPSQYKMFTRGQAHFMTKMTFCKLDEWVVVQLQILMIFFKGTSELQRKLLLLFKHWDLGIVEGAAKRICEKVAEAFCQFIRRAKCKKIAGVSHKNTTTTAKERLTDWWLASSQQKMFNIHDNFFFRPLFASQKSLGIFSMNRIFSKRSCKTFETTTA